MWGNLLLCYCSVGVSFGSLVTPLRRGDWERDGIWVWADSRIINAVLLSSHIALSPAGASLHFSSLPSCTGASLLVISQVAVASLEERLSRFFLLWQGNWLKVGQQAVFRFDMLGTQHMPLCEFKQEQLWLWVYKKWSSKQPSMVLVKLDEYVGTGDDDAMLGGASGDEFDIAGMSYSIVHVAVYLM